MICWLIYNQAITVVTFDGKIYWALYLQLHNLQWCQIFLLNVISALGVTTNMKCRWWSGAQNKVNCMHHYHPVLLQLFMLFIQSKIGPSTECKHCESLAPTTTITQLEQQFEWASPYAVQTEYFVFYTYANDSASFC